MAASRQHPDQSGDRERLDEQRVLILELDAVGDRYCHVDGAGGTRESLGVDPQLATVDVQVPVQLLLSNGLAGRAPDPVGRL